MTVYEDFKTLLEMNNISSDKKNTNEMFKILCGILDPSFKKNIEPEINDYICSVMDGKPDPEKEKKIKQICKPYKPYFKKKGV